MFSTFADFIATQAHRYAWALLIIAGVFEIAWIWTLKMTDGYTKLGPTLATIPLALCSTGLLAMAMKGLPMGTAYAIWVGIGAVGAVTIGIVMYNEPATLIRFFCIALIVAGIIGLKFVSGSAS